MMMSACSIFFAKATFVKQTTLKLTCARLKCSMSGNTHSIGEHKAALSIGVVHFDGFSREHGNDVVRTHRVAADRVLGQTEQCVQVVFESLFDGCVERAQNGRCAATVALHARH